VFTRSYSEAFNEFWSPSDLSFMRHLIGTARMRAIAHKFNGLARVVTVRAAILFTVADLAVARRVRAFISVGHDRFLSEFRYGEACAFAQASRFSAAYRCRERVVPRW
jgi:hypothetical protein